LITEEMAFGAVREALIAAHTFPTVLGHASEMQHASG
jgi:hypothetical protein